MSAPDGSGPPLLLRIDSEEANHLLRSLLAACPGETVYQVSRPFIDRDAPYQPSTLFDHAFIVTPSLAGGTQHSVVGFRLRDTDEFVLAISALYAEKFVSSRHTEAPPVKPLPSSGGQS